MKHYVGVGSVVIAFCALSACITSKQSYVKKGNDLYSAGKYADASLNYRKAIQKDPLFGEAYYRLGLAAMKENQTREAYDALYRAVQLMPNNVDAMERLADVSLSSYLADPSHPQALYQQITQLSNDLLAKNPNSYEGVMLKGYLAGSDRKAKDAIALIRKALQINSGDPGVTTELVRLLIQDGQTQEAERIGKDLTDVKKVAYGPIYDLMFSFYGANRPAEAENVLKAKVNNNPKEADYVVQLARYYARGQKPAEMKAALDRLLNDPKNFPQARLWVGDFYLGRRDYPAAIRYYQDGVQNEPKNKLTYQKKMLIALLAEGKRDDALQLADSILKDNPKDDDTLRLRADVQLDSAKPENVEAALQTFQALSAKQPNDPVLRFRVGRAYQAKGDLDAALLQFQEAVKRRKDFLAARYEIIDIDLNQGRPSEALQEANDILANRPNDPRARLLRARCLAATKQYGPAKAGLERLAKESPKDVEPRLQLGLIALKQSQYKEATDIFNGLRETGDARVFLALATTYSSQKQYDKAIQALNEGLQKTPDSLAIIGQLASTQALARNYDLAIMNFQKVIAGDPKSLSARVYLGDVYELRGDHANAVVAYQQAYQLAPANTLVALTLADALARAGHVPEARRQYESIVKAHPENATALNNLAYLLADTGGDLEEALTLAHRAVKAAPGQDDYADTVGYIYLKKGQRESAVQAFGNLVHKNPHVALFHYHLAMALFEQGDKEGARKELAAALVEHPAPQDEARIRELLNKT